MRYTKPLASPEKTNRVLEHLAAELQSSVAEIALHPIHDETRKMLAEEVLRHGDMLSAVHAIGIASTAIRCTRSGQIVGWMTNDSLASHIPIAIAPQFLRGDNVSFNEALRTYPVASTVYQILANISGNALDAFIAKRYLKPGTSVISVIEYRAKLLAHMHDALLVSPGAETLAFSFELANYLDLAPNKERMQETLLALINATHGHMAIQPASARPALAITLNAAMLEIQAQAIASVMESNSITRALALGDSLLEIASRIIRRNETWDYTPITADAANKATRAPSAKQLREAQVAKDLEAEFGIELASAFSDLTTMKGKAAAASAASANNAPTPATAPKKTFSLSSLMAQHSTKH